jgi:beta-xylosidase
MLVGSLMTVASLLPATLSASTNHSDNGDGTYTNPLIAADFPDPDVIRVGDTYYMVTTTMFVFPGVTILKSHDLVNWDYCSNAVPRFDFHEAYNLNGGSRYAHGPWATSIKYHDGKFYLLFITLDEGGFICSASNPEGPWDIRKLPKGFYDPGLFFDEDGRIYVAHGYGKIMLTELNSDFSPKSQDSTIFVGNIRGGLEGTHVYKIDGYYYLYSTYGGGNGIQVALRSKNIWGPYEQRIVMSDSTRGVTHGIHQGALVTTPKGEWWTVLFVDQGPLGRMPSLQPIRWENGWPIGGNNGKGVATYRKPDVGKDYPVTDLPTSDEFEGSTLGMQWNWNHNPDASKWSLSQRKGWLRLATANVAPTFKAARNTLTQRIFMNYDQARPTAGTLRMDVSKMKDGDVAGLAVFQDPFAYIAVRMTGKTKSLIMVNNGSVVDSLPFKGAVVYLKALASNASRKATFEFSQDGTTFRSLGNALAMRFSLTIFTGNKFCLFNQATKATGGFVDVDWFRTDEGRLPSIKATNPVIWADVPDMSMMRVGDTYYMSSTTMHMIPGVPVMKSKDLTNWVMASYAQPFLADNDAMNLKTPRGAYGQGTWASSIRWHNGLCYLSVFSNTSRKSYIFSSTDPSKGDWKTIELPRSLHDQSLFFDDNGKTYLVWGNGRINIVQLTADLSDFVPGTERVLIDNASLPGGRGGLGAEGSQLFKVKGKYYLFNISWPAGSMRTVLIHRADSLNGVWEGRVGLRDKGVAQGGLVDMPDGRWFAYLFKDNGAVGRIPYLVPVTWENGWPVLGVDGKVPMTLDLPVNKGVVPGIVNSDEFNRRLGDPALPLVWQWNHNPIDNAWSVTTRPGYLRLTTGRVDSLFLQARNTLTQRTFGPTSVATAAMDLRNMKDGDVAGLGLLQQRFGQVGVRCEGKKHFLVMLNGQNGKPVEQARIELKKPTVYLKASCDFTDQKDLASFYYSVDGKQWTKVGDDLKMAYTIPHFMGYRFGLFNYATKTTGGFVDFDWFHVSDK